MQSEERRPSSGSWTAFSGQARPAHRLRKDWESWAPRFRASGEVRWEDAGQVGSSCPSAPEGQGGESQPTSFDSSQWRHSLTLALRTWTLQESRISMPSVASLPEELL